MTAIQPQLFPAFREHHRENAKRGRETYFIKFDDIECLPEKNYRRPTNYGDIPGLADSIYANGMKQPLVVDAYVDIRGRYVVHLNDGFRRYHAIKLLREQGRGDAFETVECFINPKETTSEERILTMFTTQDNKQLEPIEQADCFKALRDNYGYTSTQIAQKVGKSRIYVDEYLKLADENDDIKQAVADNKISATAAIEVHKKEKDSKKRSEIIQEAVQSGKTKVSDIKTAVKKATIEPKGFKVLSEYGYLNFVGSVLTHDVRFNEIATGDECAIWEGAKLDAEDLETLRQNKVPFIYVKENNPKFSEGDDLYSLKLYKNCKVTDVLKSELNKPSRYLVSIDGIKQAQIHDENEFSFYPPQGQVSMELGLSEASQNVAIQSGSKPEPVRENSELQLELLSETSSVHFIFGLTATNIKYFEEAKTYSDRGKKEASMLADSEIEKVIALDRLQLMAILKHSK